MTRRRAIIATRRLADTIILLASTGRAGPQTLALLARLAAHAFAIARHVQESTYATH